MRCSPCAANATVQSFIANFVSRARRVPTPTGSHSPHFRCSVSHCGWAAMRCDLPVCSKGDSKAQCDMTQCSCAMPLLLPGSCQEAGGSRQGTHTWECQTSGQSQSAVQCSHSAAWYRRQLQVGREYSLPRRLPATFPAAVTGHRKHAAPAALSWHAPETRAHQGLHIEHVALSWRQSGRHTTFLLLCLLSMHAWLQPHCTARHTKAAGITADEGHTAGCSPRITTGATTIAPR